jgi:hypothetical protein
MPFIPWPEIEAFHNVRKYTAPDAHPEILNGNPVVSYRCKCKLHGTNAAVQVAADGTLTPQSRESLLSLEKDNAGFARWVAATDVMLPKLGAPHYWNNWDNARGHIIFGEWIGPGIQKGVAVSSIPQKTFAIFAARPLDDSDRIIVEPEELRELVSGFKMPPGPEAFPIYVLPWYTRPVAHGTDTCVYAQVNVDWSASSEELTKITEEINKWVMEVEANDPWVEETFGIRGTGEGLVFYPRSPEHLKYTDFANLCFKAKGEAHKNIKTAAPAQVSPEIAASVEAFAELVLTQARLEQGASKVALTPGIYDLKQTGKFVSWIIGDVEKETQDELAASGLTFKQVQKAISDKARAWYITKAKAL